MREDSVWNFGLIEVEIHMEHSDKRRRLRWELDISCTPKQQNLGRGFGTSIVHLRPPVA